MVDGLLTGGVGRFIRVALGFLLSKLVLLPLVAQVPGLAAFLQNPELLNYLAGLLGGLLNGLLKHLRDQKKVPSWLPL